MKSKRTIYPVLSVSMICDDGLGAISDVGTLHGSHRSLKLDQSKGSEILTPEELAHVAKTLGRLADEAVSTLHILSKEIVRDDF